jgi:hypothetical protein
MRHRSNPPDNYVHEDRARARQKGGSRNQTSLSHLRRTVTTIGLDIAKSVFQIHGKRHVDQQQDGGFFDQTGHKGKAAWRY